MVERDAVGDAAVRAVLFQEEGMFGGSRHTELLWALETLAWSPDYLPRVAVALGWLTTHDLGGTTANRPAASLRTIFLAWKPYTAASVQERLAAIDALSRRHPDVGFRLCRDLIPTRIEAANPTPRPKWRQWAVGHSESPTFAEFGEYIVGLHERALAGAGIDQARWASLINPIRDVPEEQLECFFARLECLPLERIAEEPEDSLRRAVRQVLHEKRSNEGVYPSITHSYVDRLERVYERLAPSDRARRDAWLFDAHPDLPNLRGSDWEVEQEAIQRERQEVVRGLIADEEARGLVELADLAKEPWHVGYFAGQSDLADAVVTGLLAACLEAETEKPQKFAGGVVWGRFRRDGWPWVERLFAADESRSWPATRKSSLALALPFEPATWDWVEGWGEDVAAAYWSKAAVLIGDPQWDAPRAIHTLLARRRPFAAFHLASLCQSLNRDTTVVPPVLLLQVLQAVTAVATGEIEPTEESTPNRVDGYGLGQVLVAIERSGITDERELVRLEWAWFQVLEHTERGPATLYRALANDPSFFAMLVGLVFRPRLPGREDEPVAEPDERSQARGRQAFQLLHDWRGVPGRDSEGNIDSEAIRRWVDGAREAFQFSGHVGVGDEQIGEVLARLPIGAEEAWPHESVRAILEDLQSNDIERGIYIGAVNGRGATWRVSDAGGEQERSLADRYEKWARSLMAYPRTARVVHELADHYRREAQQEDERRDLNEFWG
jgi:hypothetical protein